MSNYADEGVAELRKRAGLPTLGAKEGRINCNRCQRPFNSEDVTKFRTCYGCKNTTAYREDAKDLSGPLNPAMYFGSPRNSTDTMGYKSSSERRSKSGQQRRGPKPGTKSPRKGRKWEGREPKPK